MVGRALASVGALCDLRSRVVGGSVALGFGEPFFRAAQDELDKRARLPFIERLPDHAGDARATGPADRRGGAGQAPEG